MGIAASELLPSALHWRYGTSAPTTNPHPDPNPDPNPNPYPNYPKPNPKPNPNPHPNPNLNPNPSPNPNPNRDPSPSPAPPQASLRSSRCSASPWPRACASLSQTRSGYPSRSHCAPARIGLELGIGLDFQVRSYP